MGLKSHHNKQAKPRKIMPISYLIQAQNFIDTNGIIAIGNKKRSTKKCKITQRKWNENCMKGKYNKNHWEY